LLTRASPKPRPASPRGAPEFLSARSCFLSWFPARPPRPGLPALPRSTRMALAGGPNRSRAGWPVPRRRHTEATRKLLDQYPRSSSRRAGQRPPGCVKGGHGAGARQIIRPRCREQGPGRGTPGSPSRPHAQNRCGSGHKAADRSLRTEGREPRTDPLARRIVAEFAPPTSRRQAGLVDRFLFPKIKKTTRSAGPVRARNRDRGQSHPATFRAENPCRKTDLRM